MHCNSVATLEIVARHKRHICGKIRAVLARWSNHRRTVADKTRSEKWCFSTRHKWAHCTRSRETVLATTTHQTSLSSNVLQWRFKCLAKSDVFHLYNKKVFSNYCQNDTHCNRGKQVGKQCWKTVLDNFGNHLENWMSLGLEQMGKQSEHMLFWQQVIFLH